MSYRENPSKASRNMPISYEFDQALGFMEEIWTGDIEINDVVEFWTKVDGSEEAQVIRRSLADVRHAKPIFTPQQLQAAVRNVLLPRRLGRDWITAILVQSVQQFRMSRQYQVFAEYSSRIEIFSSRDEALTWLLRRDPRP